MVELNEKEFVTRKQIREIINTSARLGGDDADRQLNILAFGLINACIHQGISRNEMLQHMAQAYDLLDAQRIVSATAKQETKQ